MARLEEGSDEAQLKIKQLESKRDSLKRQVAEMQRQLDSANDVSDLKSSECCVLLFNVILLLVF